MKYFIICFIVASAGWVFGGDHSEAFWIFPIAGLASDFLSKRSGRGVTLPAVSMLLMVFIAINGFVFYDRISADAIVSYTIDYDPKYYNSGFMTILTCVFWFWVGAILFTNKTKKTATHQAEIGEGIRNIHGRAAGVLISIGLVGIALYVLGYGFSALIYRDHYLLYSGPRSFVTFSGLGGPFGLLALALVIYSRRAGSLTKFMAISVFSVLSLAVIASGSRALTAIPLALLWGWWIIRSDSASVLRKSLSMIGGLSIAIYAFNALLNMRVDLSGKSGISTYTEYMSREALNLIAPDVPAISGNILFGVPLTGDIVQRGAGLPLDYLFISLNPMTGGSAGWNDIKALFDWAPATPYNVYGELYNYGVLPLALTMMSLGAAVGLIDGWVARRRGILQNMTFILLLVLILIFTVFTFQYPVRNTSRFIWYAGALTLVISILTGPVVKYFMGRRERLIREMGYDFRGR